MTDKGYMTTGEAAEALGRHKRTVLRMVASGALRGFRLNGYEMRVNADDVASMIATGKRAND